MIKGMFQQSNFFTQLIIATAVATIMIIISSLFAFVLAVPLYHLNLIDFSTLLTNLDDPRNIAILKYFQIVQSLCGFVLTALLLAYLFSKNTNQYLWLERKPGVKFLIAAILLVSVIFPFINLLGELNSGIHFPHFLKGFENYLIEQDKLNEHLMESFLGDSNIRGLFVNIVMIGIIPAIGEELFFRGVVQNIFSRMTKNHHWGIWISAIIFSLIHMEFSGFIPRIVLGAMFGYMLVWSGSMWIPILAHFVNNVSAVIMYYFVNTGRIDKGSLEFGSSAETWPFVVASVILSAVFFWYFYKNAVMGPKMNEIDNVNDSDKSN